MNQFESPRVSVLMPVRNGLPWIAEAIASICRQSFGDFELIILEDGSTDDTPAFLSTVCDPRIRCLTTGGTGIAAALNTGLAVARGAYIARQDADDESLPDRLAQQVARLDARPEIALVATPAEYIDEHGRPVDNDWTRAIRSRQDPARTPESIASLMPLTCCVTHGSIMARAGVLRGAGGYRPEMVPAEDYDLWLRLMPGARFSKLEERLYRYRVHAKQTASGPLARQTKLAVLAKLLYVRRLFPHLPTRGRLAITGPGPGVRVYESVAADAGFVVSQRDADWDVMAATDFDHVEEYAAELADDRETSVERVGNLFVRYARASV
jgi:glycosyltransferase involved in cell wall biosynthesis